MDTKHRSQGDICSNVQEKIFSLIEAGDQLDSDSELNQHLDICIHCQKYLENLTLLKNRMQKPALKNLKPDSAIIKNMIMYKNIKVGLPKRKPSTILDVLRAIFEFRIPVYQVLSGALIVLMIFIYMSRQLNWSGIGAGQIQNSEIQTATSSSELYALDTLISSNAERGQNAKEDSVLIRLLVPTM